MFQPPIDLLLPVQPSQTSLGSHDLLYPLLITSPSIASVLIYLLNYHRMHKPPSNSVLVLCGPSRSHAIDNTLQNGPDEQRSAISSFLCSFETASNIWQNACRKISIVHITSLPQLSAFLSIVRGENKTFLAIWGFTEVHKSTGQYSAQGLGRTLANALDASKNGYLIIADREYEDKVINVLNEREPMQQSHSVSIYKFYARWMQSFWNLIDTGQGEWTNRVEKSLVQWKEQGNKCTDIIITKL